MMKSLGLNETIDAMRRKETPPPPAGASLREWFAGIALSNPELMKDVPPEQRTSVAVKVADEMMSALMAPRTPTGTKLNVPVAPPTPVINMENRERITVPGIRAAKRNSMPPPPCPQTEPELPPVIDPRKASSAPPKPSSDKPSVGRYSYVTPRPPRPEQP